MLALGLLAGCTPTPEPKPTKTAAFASDEEAFQAAEETYAEYTTAGNARDAGKKSPDPQDYLVGKALEGDLEAVRFFEKNDVTSTGNVEVAGFQPEPSSLSADRTQLNAVVCLDISENRLLDAEGNDITPADRPDVIAMKVEMTMGKEHFMISQELDEENERCV